MKIDVDDKLVPFTKLVNSSKRQVGKTDPEVVTLSALRALVIAAIYGRTGLARSAETVHEDELPAGTNAEQVEGSVVPLLARLLSDHFPHFASRSAITAPAVLAGLGIAVHQTTPWAGPMNALGAEDLYRLLADIQWDPPAPLLGRRRGQSERHRAPQLRRRREGLRQPCRRRDPLPRHRGGAQDPRPVAADLTHSTSPARRSNGLGISNQPCFTLTWSTP